MKKLSLISFVIGLMCTSGFAQVTHSYDTIHQDTSKYHSRDYSRSNSKSDSKTYGQQTKTYGQQTNQNVDELVKTVAENGMLSVKLGQLAQQKSSSQEVKDLARKMVDYHTSANQKLQNIAMGMNVDVPQKLDQKDQQLIDQLSKKSGDEFDKAFLDKTIQDQQEDISKLKQAKQDQKSSKNQQLDNWIDSSLPVIQQHLQMAQGIQQKSGGRNSDMNNDRDMDNDQDMNNSRQNRENTTTPPQK